MDVFYPCCNTLKILTGEKHMIFTFHTAMYSEGSRTFMTIPFNVWQETGRKGNIPCRITIQDIVFDCKLI